MDASKLALLVVAGFFAGYLLFSVRPLLSPKRRALLATVKASRKKAMEATTDDARAIALMEGAEAAALARRFTSAAGLCLRSLRLSPTSGRLVERTAKALEPRPRLLRSLFERRLGVLSTEGIHGEAYVRTVRTLAELYRATPRFRALAPALERLAAYEAAKNEPGVGSEPD